MRCRAENKALRVQGPKFINITVFGPLEPVTWVLGPSGKGKGGSVYRGLGLV